MSAVSDILKQVTIPKMVRVKQSFPRPRIEDVKAAVLAELKRPERWAWEAGASPITS